MLLKDVYMKKEYEEMAVRNMKRWLLIGGGILILAVAVMVSLYLIFWRTKNEPMPEIVFCYNDHSMNCFCIGTDGSIYKARAKSVIRMPMEELLRNIQQDDYEDIFEKVGDTDPDRVKDRYNLFMEVVVRGDYRLEPDSEDERRFDGMGADSENEVEEDWYGIYEKPSGQLTYARISGSGYTCSDRRGNRLTGWMDMKLDRYKQKSGEKEVADYPITLSEDAVIYEFSPDNIASLKSIAIDKNEKHEIRIYEFDTSLEFVTKETLERIVMNNDKVGLNITGTDGEKHSFTYDEARMFSTENSYYIMLILEHDENIHELFLEKSGGFLAVYGMEAPEVWISQYHYEQDGVNGSRRVSQQYDPSMECWEEKQEFFSPIEITVFEED